MKSKTSIGRFELFFFIFSFVYLGEVNGVDVRVPIYIFWFSWILLKRMKRSFLFSKKELSVLFLLLILLVYAMIVSMFNDSQSLFFVLRISRSILSFSIILFFFNNSTVTFEDFIIAFVSATGIHVFTVFLSIIYPSMREWVYIFSGYNKRYFEYRASGLFSSYDIAGYFINLSILFFGLLINRTKRENLLQYVILSLFIVSVFLTSRVNTAMLFFLLFLLLADSLYTKSKKGIIFYSTLGALSLLGLTIFLSLSMNLFLDFRVKMISKFPALYVLFENMDNSYAQYTFVDVVQSQTEIPDIETYFWGMNKVPPMDPGYIHTIYAVGYVGLLLILVFHLYLIMSLGYRKKGDNDFLKKSLMLLIIITFFYEVKLSFLFSSGVFEFIMMWWKVNEINNPNRLIR